MRYRIRHETEYSYGKAVNLGHHTLHLRPRTMMNQTCHAADIHLTPKPAVVEEREDYFGNLMTFFIVQQPHHQLIAEAVSEVTVHPPQPLMEGVSRPWNLVCEELRGAMDKQRLDAYQFAFDSPQAEGTAELADYAVASFPHGRPILDAALDLTQRIHADFQYDPTATTVTTPLSQVFAQRRGVCQDFAHLMIACLRALDLPARYVSGYLRTLPPPGQPRLIGADASHAWASVYCPYMGWRDFDPTNNQAVGHDHATLAWGRDYADVAPVKGLILGGGLHTVNVRVDVEPI